MDKKEINSPKLTANFLIWICGVGALLLRRWVVARCDPYRDPIPPIPREVIAETARIYIEAFETITGESFAPSEPDLPVLDRIRANLRRYF